MTDSSITGVCPHCQETFALSGEQLTTLLGKSAIGCAGCNLPVQLSSPEEIKKFEAYGASGMLTIGMIGLAALAALVAVVLKWVGIIRFETQILISGGAIFLAWLIVTMAKKKVDMTLMLQSAKN